MRTVAKRFSKCTKGGGRFPQLWAALKETAGMILSSAMRKLLSEEVEIVVEKEQAVASLASHFHQHVMLYHVIDQ